MNSVKESSVWFQPEKPEIDTEALFEITFEDEGMRVQNRNVNCLYGSLEKNVFNKAYNYLNKYLNFDFSPISVDGKDYSLSKLDEEYLEQQTLTSRIYAYARHNAKLKLKPGGISLREPSDSVISDVLISILDKKYGIDTPVSLALGARILRTPLESYRNTVKSRRQYYDK